MFLVQGGNILDTKELRKWVAEHCNHQSNQNLFNVYTASYKDEEPEDFAKWTEDLDLDKVELKLIKASLNALYENDSESITITYAICSGCELQYCGNYSVVYSTDGEVIDDFLSD